jgi:hypothetical protein
MTQCSFVGAMFATFWRKNTALSFRAGIHCTLNMKAV